MRWVRGCIFWIMGLFALGSAAWVHFDTRRHAWPIDTWGTLLPGLVIFPAMLLALGAISIWRGFYWFRSRRFEE